MAYNDITDDYDEYLQEIADDEAAYAPADNRLMGYCSGCGALAPAGSAHCPGEAVDPF